MNTKHEVLDKGFVEIIDALGVDLTVANSARVSFGKRKNKYDRSDERLVRYLAKHKHFSPFRHLVVQFHIKAPEFVTRQLYKHVVGIETTSSSITKDHAWNEISQRYVPVDEFYVPEVFRAQSEDSKQASSGKIEKQEEAAEAYTKAQQVIKHYYDNLLEMGVAKEQARAVLPEGNTVSKLYMNGTIRSWIHYIELRAANGTQKEHMEIANACAEVIHNIFPMGKKLN